MNTTWNLGLLYTSPEDPQIEKDIKVIVNACKKFEKKWKGNKDYLKKEKVLAEALADYEDLSRIIGWQKPLWYFQLLNDIQLDHPNAGARSTQISQIVTDAWNNVIFFNLDLATISKENQKKFLASKPLKNYKYHLEKIFKNAKYKISEQEEKILNIMNLPAYDMWVDGVNKQLGAQKISFGDKEMGIGEAMGIMWTLPRNDREIIYKQVVEVTKKVAPFAEGEMNAILTLKKLDDELRGYKHAYSSSIIEKQNDEKAIIHFSQIVTDHLSISERFYKIKKNMMGLDKSMTMYDVFADAGKINQSFSFEKSVEIVTSAFNSIDPMFGAYLERYIQNGQIDALPRMHKKSGAYCWKHKDLPTFVLLNHANDFNAVRTLAHEMGHAIHGELSQIQPTLYESYTTSTAEVASTFFENIAFEKVFDVLSPDEQIIALHDKVMGSVNTVFAQIAFFNFEIELHETLRKDGFVSKEKMAELMVKHRQSYLGPAVTITQDDGFFWVRLSHIRSFFYVYTYAYGELISSAMYAKYKEDKSFVVKLKKFLSAGGSDTPENIFKSIGIDTTKDEFWISGLKAIEADVIKLEKLVNKNLKESKKKK